jgi:hypothetical protein
MFKLLLIKYAKKYFKEWAINFVIEFLERIKDDNDNKLTTTRVSQVKEWTDKRPVTTKVKPLSQRVKK